MFVNKKEHFGILLCICMYIYGKAKEWQLGEERGQPQASKECVWKDCSAVKRKCNQNWGLQWKVVATCSSILFSSASPCHYASVSVSLSFSLFIRRVVVPYSHPCMIHTHPSSSSSSSPSPSPSPPPPPSLQKFTQTNKQCQEMAVAMEMETYTSCTYHL